MNTQNIYEIGMLINPDLSQQEAENTVKKIKEILTKNSASVISEGEIVKIDLAYQIITKIASKNERFNEANFNWIKLEAEPSVIDLIKKEIDKIKKEVFRYLITKTVKDDSETDRFRLAGEEESEEKPEEKLEIEVEDIEDGNTENIDKKESKSEESEESEKNEEGLLSKITKKIKGE